MTENILKEIRSVENLKDCILNSVVLDSNKNFVTVKLITDRTYTDEDKNNALKIVKKYVPEHFECGVEISKLTPDCEMVKRKIVEAINDNFRALSVTLEESDIKVEKRQTGFEYVISVMPSLSVKGVCETVSAYLKKYYCGEFIGKCTVNDKVAQNLETEEEHENIEFSVPIRKFQIADFKSIEGT